MKLDNFNFIGLLFFFFISCGPSEEDVRNKLIIEQKHQEDSINELYKKELKDKEYLDSIASVKQQSFQDSLLAARDAEIYNKAYEDSVSASNQAYQMQLIKLKGELEAAENKLNDTKQFHVGRMQWEKEEQIRKAKEEVEILKFKISQLEEVIISKK